MGARCGSASNACWRPAASRRSGSTCRRSATPAIYRARWRRSCGRWRRAASPRARPAKSAGSSRPSCAPSSAAISSAGCDGWRRTHTRPPRELRSRRGGAVFFLQKTAKNSGAAAETRRRRLAVAHPERGDEGGLRDFDLAELAHPLFAFLLLFEELAFAGDVAAIAFGQHVLAQRLDRLARHHPAAERGLDRDLEQLARDQVLEPF